MGDKAAASGGYTKFSNFEGHEGVKWELGFALFLAGKMGFQLLGLGFAVSKTIANGNGIYIFI